MDAGSLLDDVLDLTGRLGIALQRRRAWQLQSAKEVSLIFIGQESRGQSRSKQRGAGGQHQQQRNAHRPLANQQRGGRYISIGRPGKAAIEDTEEPTQRTSLRLSGTQQQRCERRAQ